MQTAVASSYRSPTSKLLSITHCSYSQYKQVYLRSERQGSNNKQVHLRSERQGSNNLGRMHMVVPFLLVVVAAAWQQPAASASPSAPASLPLPAPAPAPAPVARGDGRRARAAGQAKAEVEEFVRGCCARTLYPRLCCAGLAPYAASVHSSHARLALASANLTLAALDALAARIPPSPSPGVLGDCAEAVASAADQTVRAADRLGGVEQAVGSELLWRVDDALTGLSAAMTYEDTCGDGLSPRKSAPAPVRADLRARVRRAKQYTSIALALVNILVSNPRS